MTNLQIVITCIWVGIIVGFVYSIGAAWGGVRAGLDAVLAVVFVLLFYSGIVALAYYTMLALMGG